MPIDVRPSTRVFVWCFLAAFAVAGAVGIEAWPFSGFRLFSHVRTGEVAGWEVAAVDAAGAERPVRLEGQSWLHVAAGMAELPERQRREVCWAWAPGAPEVRVYRTWTPLDGDGGPPRRELRASCVRL